MSVGIRLPELNYVLLNGRLTRDPESFFTSGGIAKCSFSIAVNRRMKDSKTNEWKDDVFYMPIVVWREQAERCKEKLKKGSPVFVEGRLRSREFEDKSGQKRTIIEVEARRVQFLAPVSGATEGGESRGGKTAEEAAPAAEQPDQFEEVPF
ncbi:MAG: single-stranded DNA-binding protein [Elusimicrobia bacterium]|nr:single-stranded DNA-binding protein [Elusimicrobiota bacterium]